MSVERRHGIIRWNQRVCPFTLSPPKKWNITSTKGRRKRWNVGCRHPHRAAGRSRCSCLRRRGSGKRFFNKIRTSEELSWHAEGIFWSRRVVSSFQLFSDFFIFFIFEGGGVVSGAVVTYKTRQKLSGSSRRQGWVDRGTREGDRLRRPTPGRKLRSGAGSKGLRMLTRQKAEPLLGMKLTLLRSGHRKGGISCRGLGLGTHNTHTTHTYNII